MRRRRFNVGGITVLNDPPALISTTVPLCVPPAFIPLSSFFMASTAASSQGLTLVHFSAQHERFLWDKGWI